MSKPLNRKGPRVTIIFDFNMQWLWPQLHGKGELWYFHFGCLSWLVALGKMRDLIFDILEGKKSPEIHT